jgi:hypothetical protein
VKPNLARLQKGMLVSADNWWYIVVDIVYNYNDQRVSFLCICDNANNRYTFDEKDIIAHLTLTELHMAANGYWPNRDFPNGLKTRDIPLSVVAEVLCGREDDRFSDYFEGAK